MGSTDIIDSNFSKVGNLLLLSNTKSRSTLSYFSPLQRPRIHTTYGKHVYVYYSCLMKIIISLITIILQRTSCSSSNSIKSCCGLFNCFLFQKLLFLLLDCILKQVFPLRQDRRPCSAIQSIIIHLTVYSFQRCHGVECILSCLEPCKNSYNKISV